MVYKSVSDKVRNGIWNHQVGLGEVKQLWYFFSGVLLLDITLQCHDPWNGSNLKQIDCYNPLFFIWVFFRAGGFNFVGNNLRPASRCSANIHHFHPWFQQIKAGVYLYQFKRTSWPVLLESGLFYVVIIHVSVHPSPLSAFKLLFGLIFWLGGLAKLKAWNTLQKSTLRVLALQIYGPD